MGRRCFPSDVQWDKWLTVGPSNRQMSYCQRDGRAHRPEFAEKGAGARRFTCGTTRLRRRPGWAWAGTSSITVICVATGA